MARDITLHYEEAGAGAPPLVFVHGYMSRLEHWRPQVEHFSGTSRTVAVDLRGHARSPAGTAPPTVQTLGEDVAALLDSLDLSGAVLAGHSLGCRVVLEARRHAPARIAGLVLVDGSNIGSGAKETALAKLDEQIAADGFWPFARGLIEGMFVEGHDPALLAEMIRCGQEVPEAFARPLFRNLIAYDADEAIAAMQECALPVLVLQSTTFGPDRVRRALAPGESSPYMELARAHIPLARVEVVTGAGHYVHLEAPAAANAHIQAFLDTLGA